MLWAMELGEKEEKSISVGLVLSHHCFVFHTSNLDTQPVL